MHGTVQVASLWARHLLVRSRDTNVNGKIQYDGLKLRDFYSSAIQNDRSLANWTLSLSGDMRDQWLAGGGVNSWSLNWSAGRVAFDNPAARLADAATANTQGSFSKWNASFVRLQALTPDALLYLTASGQWARLGQGNGRPLHLRTAPMSRSTPTPGRGCKGETVVR